MSTWSILLSGGSGTRMNAQTNKTLLPLCGECALCRSLRALRRHCDGVVVVIRPVDALAAQKALDESGLTAEAMVPGGEDRQASVRSGLNALPEDCDIVLVHDGARPLVDDETIRRVIASVREHGTGVAAIPVADTIKQIAPDGTVTATPDRGTLRAGQTPQGFSRQLLARAHREISARCTDDAALVERLGVPVHLVAGNPRNIKLTTPEDMALAQYYLSGLPRTGYGYDAHRLTSGRRLVLGGVEIPHEKGLLGHSDADVLTHAIMDALLGAAALGDIGRHFPDKDPQYAGISSILLLEKVGRLLRQSGFALQNIDAAVVAQQPKLAPYIPRMRENIAAALGVETSRVSVKATTTEGMGFEGKGEGISAHAAALILEQK